MEIVTFEEAKEKGLKRYFTGKECRNGHLGERLVSNKHCVECTHIASQKLFQKRYHSDPDFKEKCLEIQRKWRQENPDYIRDWYKKHKEEQNQTCKDYYYKKKEQRQLQDISDD